MIVLKPPNACVRRLDVGLPEHAQDFTVVEKVLFDHVPEDFPGSESVSHPIPSPDSLLSLEISHAEATRDVLSGSVDVTIEFAQSRDGRVLITLTKECPLGHIHQPGLETAFAKVADEPPCVDGENVEMDISNRLECRPTFLCQHSPRKPAKKIEVLLSGPAVVHEHSLDVGTKLGP